MWCVGLVLEWGLRRGVTGCCVDAAAVLHVQDWEAVGRDGAEANWTSKVFIVRRVGVVVVLVVVWHGGLV